MKLMGKNQVTFWQFLRLPVQMYLNIAIASQNLRGKNGVARSLSSSYKLQESRGWSGLCDTYQNAWYIHTRMLGNDCWFSTCPHKDIVSILYIKHARLLSTKHIYKCKIFFCIPYFFLFGDQSINHCSLLKVKSSFSP